MSYFIIFIEDYEILPLNQYSKTSAYHTKQIEILKFNFVIFTFLKNKFLSKVKEKIDIFLSHDWPTGNITHFKRKLIFKRNL